MEIVIVTGSSTGIGRDCAHLLAQSGYRVVAAVRRLKDQEHLPNLQPVRLDVTKPEEVEAAVAELRSLLGEAKRVHLVNNAGIAVAGPVEAVPLKRWHEQFEVNVFGLVRVTQAFLPWIRSTGGTIVNISSVSGRTALPFLGPYAASKYAVEALSDSLRRELAPMGAKVVVVEPGPVKTPIWEKGLTRKEELPEALDEIYGPALGKFQALAAESAEAGVAPRLVSSTVLKALRASRPRTRYVVGSAGVGAQTLVASLVPDRWLDSLLQRELNRR